MYKKIKANNKIFNSPEFQKDKYKFNLILRNLPSPELELYSDDDNYIICRGSKKWPTWIWTKDNFNHTKVNEIEELIKLYLTDNKKDKFTCKKELYDLLVERKFPNLNKDDYFEMGFLICHKAIKPKECDGVLSRPNKEDRKTLEQYWYQDNIEMNGIEPITKEQAKKDVDGFLVDDKFYILRNPQGKIVSMVNYSIIDNQAKLSHVYTPIEERKKGYATNLIYLITKKLLNEGFVTLLYTDYNYIPSNKAYINAGYTDCGILINFTCSKIDNYICKIATLDEMNKKWDYEINKATDDKENWIIWKKENIERFQKGLIIPYYGLLNGETICECTAILDRSILENPDNLVNETTAYLSAFRTNKEYQGQGYFSKLFKYMINDLKIKGYKEVTLGVEPDEEKNKAIYQKYGFIEHIKNSKETYPDGTIIEVEYYKKKLD